LSAACGDAPTRKPLQDWSPGYDTGEVLDGGLLDVDGSVVDVLPEAFSIRKSPKVRWPMRVARLPDLDSPCAIETSGKLGFAKGKNIQCMIDVNELDLWVLGLQIDIGVPEGACDMLAIESYRYENFEVGTGPTAVSFTQHDDGTFSDEINARDGKPSCRYDYRSYGPNCCLGEYALKVKNAETGKVTSAKGKWEGKPADCYYGAAFLDKDAKFTEEGWPEDRIVYAGRKYLRVEMDYDGVSDKYASNIALASYVQAADHDKMLPAGLRGLWARPTYAFTCLDDAAEIIARIDVTVREWNEEVEFNRPGDSNTTGTEAGWDISWDQIDDLTDWKTQTPGSSEFPNLPRRSGK
jgi:hypothetical protein